jgi:broad specificity phosphatase PhoE
MPLTPQGDADARALRHRLAVTRFDQVLTSPLRRASRTAELAGYAATLDPDLQEWDYGDYEGLTTTAIRTGRPDWELFQDGCPGGEFVDEVVQRVDRVVTNLRGLKGNVLIFSHGHLLRALAARWVGQPITFARALLLSTSTISILCFGHDSLDEPAISMWNSI